MRKAGVALASLLCVTAAAQDYDYFAANRALIGNGVAAVLTCNGLFTSDRPLEAVVRDELRYSRGPSPNTLSGMPDIQIDQQEKRVLVGANTAYPARAVFRDGIGCVVMAPDQTDADIDALPRNPIAAPAYDPATTPWPMGDVVSPRPLPTNIDAAALAAASNWTFDRPTKEQVTISLLVVHDGQIVHERYASGFDKDTRTRTWSTAKSIAAVLIGMLVDRDKLSLDAPLPIEWLPAIEASEVDPRRGIRLRDVLQMSSGLEPVDSFNREYATGSGLAYWAGASSADGARARGLIREPGAFWDYENYDTLLAVLAMKNVLGDQYLTFPYESLLAPLGMHSTLLSTDRFGDFILSSQVYTNARDLARFGLFLLQDGVWQGKRFLSSDWLEFARTPAPSTAHHGNFYGGQFWLVPDDRDDVPRDAFATAGNRGQYVIVVPSHSLVIVRRGLDYGNQGFDRWDLTREVLKAFAND
ncbi:MAG: serine hydrolase [Pseudomonadota bacterium]